MQIIEKQNKIAPSKTELTKFRLRYAGVHLMISALLGVLTVSLVFGLWYPSPLAKALGVTHVFVMMLVIDVILGPLLTLLVAKPMKRTLKFDLLVIGFLQIAALIYGIYHIGLGRPAYVAFDVTRFEVAVVKNIDENELAKAPSAYQKMPMFGYQWVAVTPAKNADEQLERMMVQIETGYPQTLKVSLYEPVQNQWRDILAEAKPLSDLNQFNSQEEVGKVIARYPQAQGFLPLRSSVMDMTVLVGDNDFKKIVDLRPWE